MPTRRTEKRLRAGLDHAILAARQLTFLEELHKELLGHLSAEPKLSIIFADTVLYEFYNDARYHYAWAIGALQQWLGRNLQLTQELKRSVIYRYIFLPVLEAIDDPFLKRHFVDVVLFNLHVNLWHGVVTCVAFLDPARFPPKVLARRVNMTSIPLHHAAYTSSEWFYGSSNYEVVRESGEVAERHTGYLNELISQSAFPPIWLWYDELNYSRDRLVGARWEAIRTLFYALEDKPFICPWCKKEGIFNLDHILPIADGHPQTLLNFMGLCGSCNQYKGDRYPRFDPFAFPQFVPPTYRTEALHKIIADAPPWLGLITRPLNVREIRKVTL